MLLETLRVEAVDTGVKLLREGLVTLSMGNIHGMAHAFTHISRTIRY